MAKKTKTPAKAAATGGPAINIGISDEGPRRDRRRPAAACWPTPTRCT